MNVHDKLIHQESRRNGKFTKFLIRMCALFVSVAILMYFVLKSLKNANIKIKMFASSQNCSVTYYEQPLDHFTFDQNAGTYFQRVLMYDKFWKKEANGPIFFYCGNEGDVTLYADNTGLMWENAEELGALIIFAEHRYYGKSGSELEDKRYLSHEQALADYARFLYHFKYNESVVNSAVIAFGGSYGGMLSAWMRMKYPSVIDGAISASAPIFAFHSRDQVFHGTSYWKIVTDNAKPSAGASRHCASNIKAAWSTINNMKNFTKLSSIFKTCTVLTSSQEVQRLSMFLMMAYDTLAMGNYPYESSYLTQDGARLPKWPFRKACEYLSTPLSGEELLHAMHQSTNVYNNASQSKTCHPLPTLSDFDGIWDYQWCTEMLPQESYFDSNGISDMFWNRTITMDNIIQRCQRVWNTTPNPNWIAQSYGNQNLNGATNIVFSNGQLDPWSSGGVHKSYHPSIQIVKIKDGAHHLDLFFSHDQDPPSVINARNVHMKAIKKWLQTETTL